MEKVKQIFLEKLPRYTVKDKEYIDWRKSIGYIVPFIYDDIKGTITIIDYVGNSKIKIEYKNNYANIRVSDFKRCMLGGILNKQTNKFKIQIGHNINDKNRNMDILYREYRKKKHGRSMVNEKWYKYYCNKCGYEGWIEESSLIHGTGCGCCCKTPRKVCKGINDIATINPDMIKYFVNIEDAYTHTCNSDDKVLLKCPNCGTRKVMKISTLHRQGFSCPKCGDGISYPEKFMLNLLEQLKQDKQLDRFVYQYSKTNADWCGKYRYDFYFEKDGQSYIIETHGIQHYKENNNFKQTLLEVQQNDSNKREVALKNAIKSKNYIVIDCSQSSFEFIKKQILLSGLNSIFDIKDIDWKHIEYCSRKSIIKSVCDLWNVYCKDITQEELAKMFNISRQTVISYLKIGNENNWCNWNDEKKIHNSNMKKRKNKLCKQVIVKKGDIVLGCFYSVKELVRNSEALFGVKFTSQGISAVCLNKAKTHRGYIFEYINQKG